MSAQKPRIAGTFRIVHMDAWDEDCLDLEGPPFIRFERGGEGELRFCAVEAGLDFRNTKRDGAPAVEFSFQGSEEGEDVFGRGWAVLESPGHIKGMLFFHLGDESGFAAERVR